MGLAEIDLRDLAGRQADEARFVSFYRHGPEGPGLLARRADKLRAALEDDPAERARLDAGLELVERWLADHASDDPDVVVFADGTDGFVAGAALEVEVPNLLRFGAAPFLRPLAELQEEYEDFVVVTIDDRAAGIELISSGVVAHAERVRGDVKNRVKKGGWSQKRYARRRENQLGHYVDEVVLHLRALARERDFRRLVVLGGQEARVALHEALPQDLLARVVDERAADLHAGEKALLELAFESFWEEERDEEQRLWERIRAEAKGDGLAALGPDEVVPAALQGRVDTLLVTRDAELQGSRCRRCETLFAERQSSCPACGADDPLEIELVDALVRHVERTGGDVEFADPLPGLSRAGDVAALLRW